MSQVTATNTTRAAPRLTWRRVLTEADHLASRIAIIDHDKVIAEGTKGELKAC